MINLIDPRQYKFGSVAWQDAMAHNIEEKMSHGEELGPAEITFIQVTKERLARVKA